MCLLETETRDVLALLDRADDVGALVEKGIGYAPDERYDWAW